MRKKRRIFKILYLIFKIWVGNPNLRLMQLLGNCFEPGDNYNVEDNTLYRKLKKNYGGVK